MKVSELVAEIMELERTDPTMYYFAMDMLFDNLLQNLKRVRKANDKKRCK